MGDAIKKSKELGISLIKYIMGLLHLVGKTRTMKHDYRYVKYVYGIVSMSRRVFIISYQMVYPGKKEELLWQVSMMD